MPVETREFQGRIEWFNPATGAVILTINEDGSVTFASSNFTIGAGAIGTTELAALAVTVAKMAANSIDSDQYIDASIDTAHFATGAVDAAALGALSVTEAKLGVSTADALNAYRIARATYDFSVDGGAVSAISLTTTLPDNAIIVGGFLDVLTTFTSSGDSATIAIHVEGANDIVTAVAISAATDWDAGLHAIIPKANTPESTGVKTTSAQAITATIAVEAVTAGKFVVWLYYVVSD